MSNESRRSLATFVAAVTLPLLTAALLVPLRDDVDNANVALILAAVVVVVAALGHRVAVVVAAASGAVWFDFFHTKPYESFTISNRDDVVTAVVLLAVGVLVGELAIRGRRHRVMSETRRNEIERIHAVAEMVTAGESAAHLVLVVAGELRELLGLRDCRYEPAFPGDEPPLTATLERDGRVMMGDLEWGAGSAGLPGKRVDLTVQVRGQVVGRYVMTPSPGEPVALERRVVAVALADQVGASVGVTAGAR